MEQSIDFFKQCVKSLLAEYELAKTDWSEVELIFDDNRMRYLAMRVGWFGEKRVHRCLVHIDICDGMVVIQANNTENLVREELVEMGIPREKICLGFIPPVARAYAERKEKQEQLQPA